MAIIDELNNLGDAVRERSGLTEKMTMSQMADVVRNIPQPDLSPYATIEYVDESIANIDIPEVDLSNYSTTEEMNQAISASKYRIAQGLFYDMNNNAIGVSVNSTGRLVFNNGRLDINQNNLFAINNNIDVINNQIEGYIPVEGANTISAVPSVMTNEALDQWINKMISGTRQINFLFQGNGMGFGTTLAPNTLFDYSMPNGKTYSFAMDFTNGFGPNMISSTGITGFYLCYNGNYTFDIILISNGKSLPAITAMRITEVNTNPSFAHFWPDNGFRRYNNNGMMFVGLNDSYINNLIDNKLSGIAMAEEVEV